MKKAFKNYDVLELLLAAVVIVEILFLVYYNFVADYIYDPDASMVMYRAVKIWENKSLVIPDWKYETTGEWDCASFLAIFIYGITKNIIRSFAAANVINIVIFALVVYTLLSSVGVGRKYIYLALTIIFIPYGWSMLAYTNMLFVSAAQYIYKVMTPLCVLAVLHYRDRYQNRVVYTALLLWTLLLVFLTVSSSGLYVVVCGIAAILLTRVAYLMVRHCWPHKDRVLVWILVLLVIGGSYYLHNRWGINSSADSMKLNSLWSIPEVRDNILVGYIGVFHLLNESFEIFSRLGLTDVAKLPIVLFILIFGLSNLRYTLCLDGLMGRTEESNGDRYLIKAELISMTMINCLIMLLTTPAQSRYHLIGVIPLILLAAMTLDDVRCNSCLIYILLAVVIMNNAFLQYDAYGNVNVSYRDNWSKDFCQEIIDTARENHANTVVFFDDQGWASMIRTYDTDLEVITYITDESRFEDYDIVNGDKDTSYIDDKDCILVISADYDMNNAPDFVRYNVEYLSEINGYSVYIR